MLAAGLGCAMDNDSELKDGNEKMSLLRKTRWSTPIRSILPEDFVLEDKHATDAITIEDALSHRTGLAGADIMYGDWMGQKPKAIVKVLRHLGPLAAPIRTAWQYNNLMYSTVADVLETVTNWGWGSALRRLIWDPLGMKHTYWHLDEVPSDQKDHLAQGYFWTESSNSKANDAAQHFVPEPYLEFAGIAPAGSVISSANDVAEWIKALLSAAKSPDEKGTTQANPVISNKLFAELTTPRMIAPQPPAAVQNTQTHPRLYSLGWFHMPSVAGISHPIVAHAGGLNGFGTQMYLLPNDGFGCVVMCNTLMSGHRVAESIVLELMARKLGLSAEVKEEFRKTLTVIPPLDEAKQEDGTLEEASSEAKKEPSPSEAWLQFTGQVVGTYSNPAYGKYAVQSHEPGAERITYDSALPRDKRKKRDGLRSNANSLSFIPLGHRTWNNRFILHSRAADAESSIKAGNADSTTKFLDLEYFMMHGSPLEAAAQAGGKQASHDPMPSLSVWESARWCPYGGAVKFEGGSTRLGVRLGMTQLHTDGKDTDGWEKEMVWFEKTG